MKKMEIKRYAIKIGPLIADRFGSCGAATESTAAGATAVRRRARGRHGSDLADSWHVLLPLSVGFAGPEASTFARVSFRPHSSM